MSEQAVCSLMCYLRFLNNLFVSSKRSNRFELFIWLYLSWLFKSLKFFSFILSGVTLKGRVITLG